jgi:hypothetical protein
MYESTSDLQNWLLESYKDMPSIPMTKASLSYAAEQQDLEEEYKAVQNSLYYWSDFYLLQEGTEWGDGDENSEEDQEEEPLESDW